VRYLYDKADWSAYTNMVEGMLGSTDTTPLSVPLLDDLLSSTISKAAQAHIPRGFFDRPSSATTSPAVRAAEITAVEAHDA
jgi:hypothetical protein